jgi:hypothetical protein
MAKRRTLPQQIADLNAEGLALMRDSADHSLRLAQIRRELEQLKVRLEAERRRRAAHMRKVRLKRPERTVQQEVERWRKSVETRRLRLATIEPDSDEWHRAIIGLRITEGALSKAESYAAMCVHGD